MENLNQLIETIYNNKNTQEPILESTDNHWLITGEYSLFKTNGSLAYLINLPTALLNLVVFGTVNDNSVDSDLNEGDVVLSVELGGEDIEEDITFSRTLLIKIDDTDAKNILMGKNLYDVIIRKISEKRQSFYIKEVTRIYSLEDLTVQNSKDVFTKIKSPKLDLIPAFLKQIVVNFS